MVTQNRFVIPATVLEKYSDRETSSLNGSAHVQGWQKRWPLGSDISRHGRRGEFMQPM